MITVNKGNGFSTATTSMYQGEGALLKVSASEGRPDLIGKFCVKVFPDTVVFVEEVPDFKGSMSRYFKVYNSADVLKDKTQFTLADRDVVVTIRNK